MASSSPGAPKTIKQYQTALVRLGVAIPAGQKKLADYEALWRVAVSPDENAEPTNSTEPLAREKSPARSRPTRNVPLSQQTPRNIPLSQQTPPAPRTPVPADDGVDAPTTSPDEDALVTDATTEASQHPSRSSWALPAAMLVGCAVILFVALSLGTVHAPDRTAIVSAGHPFEAASDAEATWTALDRAELAAEAVASGETERGDTEPEEAASVQAEAAEEEAAVEAAVEEAAAAEETHAVTEAAETVAQVAQTTADAAAASPDAAETVDDETEVPREALRDAEESAAVRAVEGAEEAASAKGASAAVVSVEGASAAVVSVGKDASAMDAPIDDMAPAVAAHTPSAVETLLWAAVALGRWVQTGAVWALRWAAWLSVSVSQTLRESETVRWVGGVVMESSWTGLTTLVSGAVQCVALLVEASLSMLAIALPWLARTAPAALRTLTVACLAQPELTAACVALVGAAHLFGRACFRCGRSRTARRARETAQVDAAARWVVRELSEHTQRWRRIGSHERVVPLSPSELRERVPHAVLAEPTLWGRVAQAVRNDVRVEVRALAVGGGEGEGWLLSEQALVRP